MTEDPRTCFVSLIDEIKRRQVNQPCRRVYHGSLHHSVCMTEPAGTDAWAGTGMQSWALGQGGEEEEEGGRGGRRKEEEEEEEEE